MTSFLVDGAAELFTEVDMLLLIALANLYAIHAFIEPISARRSMRRRCPIACPKLSKGAISKRSFTQQRDEFFQVTAWSG